MRITGGKFGGRNLAAPKTDLIRPTQDRVREALFNILMPELPGARFLDLFAGSGAVGIEALSRGAAEVTLVERDRRHLQVLKANLVQFGIEASVTVVAAEVYGWLECYVGEGFEMVFADPPYALGEARGYGEVLRTLAARGVVRLNGLFVAEMTAVQRVDEIPGWDRLRDRTYGKTRILIWRRTK